MIHDNKGVLAVDNLPELFRFSINDDDELQKIVNEIRIEGMEGTLDFTKKEYIKIISVWKPVRPIPRNKYWFENIWREFRANFLT